LNRASSPRATPASQARRPSALGHIWAGVNGGFGGLPSLMIRSGPFDPDPGRIRQEYAAPVARSTGAPRYPPPPTHITKNWEHAVQPSGSRCDCTAMQRVGVVRSQPTETAGVGYGGHKIGVGDRVHPCKDDWVLDPEHLQRTAPIIVISWATSMAEAGSRSARSIWGTRGRNRLHARQCWSGEMRRCRHSGARSLTSVTGVRMVAMVAFQEGKRELMTGKIPKSQGQHFPPSPTHPHTRLAGSRSLQAS